jgi:hypothetical protein
VIRVNSPRPSDDELLRELGAALRELPVDEAVIRAARDAFTWRTVDEDLEFLSLDADFMLPAAAPAGQSATVRSGAHCAPRALVFHGDQLRVEIEIDEVGIVGQIVPAQPGDVTVVSVGGARMTAQADEVGCFALPPPEPGPMRLDCTLGSGRRFVTEWVAA